ncbi:EAL domain-containing protein (putative c-di-GMP-specific phosphodiesterase class I) [Caulobacter ginsengisoli]|uniref:EAL domain-containing protein (Putative c-di-GMP-specific phosphodiesterase class I) n=1 Tax=Caulobacter ginsengisoli TaxID=400775 RepID=A0ABU0IK77_9CAUL|nr:EAL domain-containing protein [Caulobacter ginsengisoli]MDQ0462416.1 EAL domain-containing protein (putative c-di-GMP-specific phosphodiesterase class I) [Caulobacter ginsengisoli]
MSNAVRRLAGFAFTSADLLLEIDLSGAITFVLGAAQAMVGKTEQALISGGWRFLIDADDRPLLEAMFAALDDGARRGPVQVRLAAGGAISLTARMLSENPGVICCAIAPAAKPALAPKAGQALHDRAVFEDLAKGLAEAARVTGQDFELAMIEFNGLEAVRKALTPPEAATLDQQVAGALRAEAQGGGAATHVEGERYALLRERGEAAEVMAKRLSRAIRTSDQAGAVTAAALAVPIENPGAARFSKALRFALDDFAREGIPDSPPASLAEAMNRSVRRTLTRAGELGMAVSQRRFTLAYQPVLALKDHSVSHHEALVRFEDGADAFAMVRMAEEFELIEELDRAIAEQAVRQLNADRTGRLKLAVNVSGASMISSPFIEGLTRLIERNPKSKGRLIFELTESSAIDDFDRANAHIQTLREMGSMVCLDDFGSGAASLGYLQRLSVDIIKIDGRYVRDLASEGRDAALVRHIVRLAKDLKVRTVAEMVETAEIEEVVRREGVDFAQGWLYGRPMAIPEWPDTREAAAPLPARRMGTRDDWR